MSLLILCKLNVAKITKERLFPGKDGAKWLDIALIPTPDSEYGDFMIVESVSREERASGKKGPILGNAKYASKGQLPAKGPRPNTDSETKPPF